MSTPDQSREPCPDRILDDIGGAFGMGAVGGSVFHFIKGVKNSPRGERLIGGGQAVRMNAPRVGGSFAVWGGLFSTFDCSMVYLRQKEDPWNSIFAGAATGGFLQMRHGLRSASRSALVGGVLLALIEGAGLMINRVLANMAQMPPPPLEEPLPQGAGIGGILGAAYGGIPSNLPNSAQGIPSSSNETSSSGESKWSSWMEGWTGGKKEESRTQATETLGSLENTSGREISSGFPASSEKSNSGEPKWSSWTGGWLGGKKEESRTSGSETLGSGSFETSSGTPMPTFEYK